MDPNETLNSYRCTMGEFEADMDREAKRLGPVPGSPGYQPTCPSDCVEVPIASTRHAHEQGMENTVLFIHKELGHVKGYRREN